MSDRCSCDEAARAVCRSHPEVAPSYCGELHAAHKCFNRVVNATMCEVCGADLLPPVPLPPRVIQMVNGHPAFWCPVCDCPHWLDTRWKWNGDRDKPTFGPAHPGAKSSYLSFAEWTFWRAKRKDKPKFGEWKHWADDVVLPNDNWELEKKRQRRVYCHSHVTDGMIRVLPDSPGPYSGKTVPLKPWVAHDDERSWPSGQSPYK